MYERASQRRPLVGESIARLGEELLVWLRNRSLEHWLMFAMGLALGVLAG